MTTLIIWLLEAFTCVTRASLTPHVTGTYKLCDKLLVVTQLCFDHILTLLKTAGTYIVTLFSVTSLAVKTVVIGNESMFYLNET